MWFKFFTKAAVLYSDALGNVEKYSSTDCFFSKLLYSCKVLITKCNIIFFFKCYLFNLSSKDSFFILIPLFFPVPNSISGLIVLP